MISTHTEKLTAPFLRFGDKSHIAPVVWQRFGSVASYIEPFAGSLAVLLGRPNDFDPIETINAKDGFICNFWRAVTADPKQVAYYVNYPINECDLHARHKWLVERTRSIVSRLKSDLDWFSAKVAGWWAWKQYAWIGSDWCSRRGPWHSIIRHGKEHLEKLLQQRRRKKMLPLDVCHSITGNLPFAIDDTTGVLRKRPHLGDTETGVHRRNADLLLWFEALAARLRRVCIYCGDWYRICGGKRGDTITSMFPRRGANATCGVFLDPPYGKSDGRNPKIYAVDSLTVAGDVRAWAIRYGNNPKFRIALCGYSSFTMPVDWTVYRWKTTGSYGTQSKNKRGQTNTECDTIWFSPYCLKTEENILLSA